MPKANPSRPKPRPPTGTDGGPDTARLHPEPGSFRDPPDRVFHADGEVLRGLGAQAAQDWKALAASDFFAAHAGRGHGLRTEEVAPPAGGEPGRWAAVLRHERIPFVSYPYEWSFGMLRDAALLHLELLRDALDGGLHDEGRLGVQPAVARRARRSVHRHRLVRAGARRASRGPATGSSARPCSTR